MVQLRGASAEIHPCNPLLNMIVCRYPIRESLPKVAIASRALHGWWRAGSKPPIVIPASKLKHCTKKMMSIAAQNTEHTTVNSTQRHLGNA